MKINDEKLSFGRVASSEALSGVLPNFPIILIFILFK